MTYEKQIREAAEEAGGLSLKQSFITKKLYNKVYSELPVFDFNQGSNLFYGRMDEKNNVVHVNEQYLKQIKSTKSENIFCLNFVADAFEDFKSYIKEEYFLKLSQDDFLTTEWDAFRGWQSPHTFYDNRMTEAYQILVRGDLTYKKNIDEIYNVDDFVKVFFNSFYSNAGPKMPMTKSGLILSKYYNPTSTGLCIEIESDSFSYNFIDIKRYLESPNFKFYVLSAAKFGFMIDRHAPWRMVANLNSFAMKKYMESYGVSIDNLFEEYYLQTYKYDISNLKVYIKQMYASFTSVSPSVLRSEPCGSGQKIVQVLREKINSDEYDKKYDDVFWLKLYYRIRLNEASIQKDDDFLTRELIKIEQLYNSLDFEKALEYINDTIKEQIVWF